MDNLTNLMNNCEIISSKEIVEKAIDQDLSLLVTFYLSHTEPQLSCEYNEYYDHPHFNSSLFLKIINTEYHSIVKRFIQYIKQSTDAYIDQNEVLTYIDYYIEINSGE